ncbi:unnamed protein product, partial [Closterium sp. NIES-53]
LSAMLEISSALLQVASLTTASSQLTSSRMERPSLQSTSLTSLLLVVLSGTMELIVESMELIFKHGVLETSLQVLLCSDSSCRESLSAAELVGVSITCTGVCFFSRSFH